MKVQLTAPPGRHLAHRWSTGTSMPPLGLLYIGAVLEKEGIAVKITPADMFGWSWRRVSREIHDFSPDIIGVMSTTENRFQSFKLIKVAKKTQPEALKRYALMAFIYFKLRMSRSLRIFKTENHREQP